MPRYTMRLIKLSNSPRSDDFVFCVDGKAAGRCCLTRVATACEVWLRCIERSIYDDRWVELWCNRQRHRWSIATQRGHGRAWPH
jgi:hypothetical protein